MPPPETEVPICAESAVEISVVPGLKITRSRKRKEEVSFTGRGSSAGWAVSTDGSGNGEI